VKPAFDRFIESRKELGDRDREALFQDFQRYLRSQLTGQSSR